MRWLLTLLLTLIGCGRPGENPDQPTVSPVDQLAARYQLYSNLAPRGWEVSDKCDALLFVSLQHIGLVGEGPVEDAMASPGRWFRLPSQVANPEFCSSDISRDMFQGLFNYIWKFQRLDLAEQIWEYGDQHNWQMGEERKTPNNRTVFMPSTIGLLAELIYHLGGEDHPQRFFSEIETYSAAPGYVSHLSLLQIHLRGQMRGHLSDNELDVLRKILQHMSQNPLAHALLHKYTDGDQTEATRLLLSIWPPDRLPNHQDWEEEWRVQRSDGDTGFQPGTGTAQHSGGDFLFTAALILGY